MPQNRETGRAANRFGHHIARIIAKKMGLEFIGHRSSNKCKGPKGICLIKSARTSSYIGVLKSMLPALDMIYAAIKVDEEIYQVFEISRSVFEKFMFEPTAERNKHLWFVRVRDIKTLRPIEKLVIPVEF
jgi:hypothetical protein